MMKRVMVIVISLILVVASLGLFVQTKAVPSLAVPPLEGCEPSSSQPKKCPTPTPTVTPVPPPTPTVTPLPPPLP
jgi:hypothetical protein